MAASGLSKRFALFLSILLLPFSGGISHAFTQSTGALVEAVVQANCTVTATGVYFGPVASGSTTAAGTVTVNCNPGVAFNIAMDAGTNPSGGLRRLYNQGVNHWLPYTLYQGTGTVEWGDAGFGNTFAQGAALPGEGTGADQAYTVTGMMSVTGAPPGPYDDTVTITVHY